MPFDAGGGVTLQSFRHEKKNGGFDPAADHPLAEA
jgi:hypothetical protein